MILKYGIEISNDTIVNSLKKKTNQIYKLLPNREEGLDWEKPLTTILEEFAGMSRLLVGQQDTFFSLVCKLEGLFLLTEEEDFFSFRRTIFECLSLIRTLSEEYNNVI